jgi:sugar/nucleoside kinase (ribokinase family)
MENCDIFMSNELESCSITGVSTPEQALGIISQYTDTAVVKLGGNGSIAKSGNNIVRLECLNG